MKNKVTVALDAMGGDNAPQSVISALNSLSVKLMKSNLVDFHFKIYGDSDKISFLIKDFHILKKHSELIHSDTIVLSSDKPSLVLRKRKSSSMHQAVLAVSNKEADCVVSAGNTGALMVISRVLLGMLPDINRSALVTTLPHKKGEFVMLDLGANIDSNSEVLFQFGVMGTAFCQSLSNKKYPKVALLNIGSEEEKGTDTIKEAYHLFKTNEDKINFVGYVEPDAMLNGDVDVDVVVTDGFSGNLMLKMAEGVFYLIKDSIKECINSSFFSKILSPFFAMNLKKALIRFDPKLRNGAMLVGLNGIVIKAHGSSDEVAFLNATEVAISAALNNINQQIITKIDGINNYDG